MRGIALRRTCDVILSRKPEDWAGFFAAIQGGAVPVDYLDARERAQAAPDRDPLAGLGE